jgi:hypothetical protein
MATKVNSKIIGVKSSSLALFEGVFAGIFGLGVAIMWSLQSTLAYGEATGSVLRGMVFGIAAGAISIIVIPLVYFAFGWILGYIHGFVFNVISETSGGIMLRIENTKK